MYFFLNVKKYKNKYKKCKRCIKCIKFGINGFTGKVTHRGAPLLKNPTENYLTKRNGFCSLGGSLFFAFQLIKIKLRNKL